MPEGHSVHRIARQFDRNFVGKQVHASSPQGRFAEGAALLDRREMLQSRAVGKQLFIEFGGDLWLRVHLGIYGAWDFAGQVMIDPTIASSNGRMGQTNHHGTVLDGPLLDEPIFDDAGENSLASIGAPRRTRMGEETSALGGSDATWPPAPVGQVRLRLLTDTTLADLRGPTACEVQTPDEVLATIARLGPDPLVDDPAQGEERFVAGVRNKRTPIGLVLMDQSAVSGIGNVYRAEMLFRAGINPHTPTKDLTDEQLRGLWRDWVRLLNIGVEVGQMMTMDDLTPEQYRAALASRDDRHFVYRRQGLPCRVCGTNIALEEIGARKLYWCPSCQA